MRKMFLSIESVSYSNLNGSNSKILFLPECSAKKKRKIIADATKNKTHMV